MGLGAVKLLLYTHITDQGRVECRRVGPRIKSMNAHVAMAGALLREERRSHCCAEEPRGLLFYCGLSALGVTGRAVRGVLARMHARCESARSVPAPFERPLAFARPSTSPRKSAVPVPPPALRVLSDRAAVAADPDPDPDPDPDRAARAPARPPAPPVLARPAVGCRHRGEQRERQHTERGVRRTQPREEPSPPIERVGIAVAVEEVHGGPERRLQQRRVLLPQVHDRGPDGGGADGVHLVE